MTLREQLEVSLFKVKEGREEIVEDLLQVFKKWAVELVGEDSDYLYDENSDYDADFERECQEAYETLGEAYTEGGNFARKEIRQRIEGAIK